MKRRDFLQTGLIASALVFGNQLKASADFNTTASSDPKSFALDEISILELQKGMNSGQYTSRFVTESYLARAEEIDKSGPGLNSIIQINPDALTIATQLDRERKEKGSRGPLHGIPILIKDNIDTADRLMTTAGSLALLDSKPAQDAFIVKKLREAGAVIMGKTNLSEWANFRSTRSSSGWSARGGQTRNPYVLDRNPCGSSSGSGVATAANLCAASIGTETDGSIVCPSSANSLVGIKPTVGLLSRSGIIPIAHSQDTAGPIARTVSDAVVLLGALTGNDPRDSATRSSQGKSFTDYTRHLSAEALRGARIGVARKHFGFNDHVDRLIEGHLPVLRDQGAVLVDPADIPTTGTFDESELEVLLFEFKADLNAYLAGLGPQAPVRSLQELIDFNEKHRDREMPYFGQELFIRAQEKGPLTSRAYLRSLRNNHRLTRVQGIDLVMRKHRLDALVAPTGGPAWPTDLINGDHFSGGYSSASAVSGYPHITVPAGYVFGLPVGLSFFAGPYSEPKLISLAYAFEQATQARRPPKFLATAPLEKESISGL